ncbi:unnamed protein product [Parascedosporium putredinis]|uniref:FAD-binding PCMH-type domain-containing protein n=1 Tax=Parascedosporium putredinis TaxID=1442378 RepID=A0A9P1M7R2_9PEZI|nr:unnamed protein product [Parascedosporium putredinis]CAI7991021.1 unnamed protein product [Parascedosporium putredinis]
MHINDQRTTPGLEALGPFFDDVSAIIGDANISRDSLSGALVGPEGQTSYDDPYCVGTDHQPSGAVRPQTVEEVQEVIRIANKHRVPLWTVSRGKNLGYGGSAPVVSGTIVLDLQRMKKIIDINEKYGYAIVEPGVSFFDLYEEIQRRGLHLWPSVPAIADKKVLGVVTKLGIHITPAPEAYSSAELDVPHEEDLGVLIEILSDLMRRSIILNSPSIANSFRIAMTSGVPEVQGELSKYMKPGSCVPYEVLDRIQAEQGWGFWRAYFSLYGSVEMIPALKKTIQWAFNAVPDVQIRWRDFAGTEGQPIKAADIKEEEIPHAGIPTLAPLGLIGTHMYPWYLAAKEMTLAAGFDFFADFHVFPRYVNAIELVIYTLPEEKEAMGLYERLLVDATERGYMEYRTHVKFMDKISGKLDFNESAFPRLLSRLKDTLDPNGILAPGKSGIWNSPKSS